MSRILIGISGGIGAYKIAYLVRLFIEAGHEVKVIMTQGACQFITPLTLATLSQNRVYTDLFDDHQPMDHIQLARWADIVLLAPASAQTIAKVAHGFAEDLLSTCVLAYEGPIAIAPAMNTIMWQQSATQHNITTLKSRHWHILGPDSGFQACQEVGPGRLLEPQIIFDQIQDLLSLSPILTGLNIMITAGPTIEPIDAARFLSNHSSGKMGYALAQGAKAMGASVTLIHGPTAENPPDVDHTIAVFSARDMHEAVMKHACQCDILIGAAAVADYHIKNTSSDKIKKTGQSVTLELEENPDILTSASQLPTPPWIVSFAAETDMDESKIRAKMQKKGAKMIAANDVGQPDIGFNHNDNALMVLTQHTKSFIPKASKDKIALSLLHLIKEHYESKHST